MRAWVLFALIESKKELDVCHCPMACHNGLQCLIKLSPKRGESKAETSFLPRKAFSAVLCYSIAKMPSNADKTNECCIL